MQILRKTTWMPYSYIGKLVISFLLLSNFSCNTIVENEFYTLYTYKNQSTYDINIVAYFTGGTEERTHFIEDDDELVQSTELFAIDNADSVQVTFDPDGSPKIAKFINPKYLGGQTSNINNKFNILYLKNFEHYNQGSNHNYDYTFTLDDYNNAE